jgi:hypothetical protein
MHKVHFCMHLINIKLLDTLYENIGFSRTISYSPSKFFQVLLSYDNRHEKKLRFSSSLYPQTLISAFSGLIYLYEETRHLKYILDDILITWKYRLLSVRDFCVHNIEIKRWSSMINSNKHKNSFRQSLTFTPSIIKIRVVPAQHIVKPP